MTRWKVSLSAPPEEWVRDLLQAHQDLQRVQMLWRLGNVPYRPLVAGHVKLEDLVTDQDWEAHEAAETHFDYVVVESESPARRRQRIAALVEELWGHADSWTRTRIMGAGFCDFKLVGYDGDGDVLFERGRRLKLDDPTEPETTQVRSEPIPERDMSPAWRELHRHEMDSMENLLGFLRSDRDDMHSRYKRMLDDNQRMWAQSHQAAQEAFRYQREQFDLWKEHYSGRVRLKAEAFAEMEQTARVDRVIDFLMEVYKTTIAHAVPLVNRAIDVLGDRNFTVFPEFRCGQQAMSYLVNTLNQTQLDLMFEQDRQAAGAFLAVMHKASQFDIERDALEYIGKLVRLMRTQRFLDLANPEQQMAVRFIMGRLALYRMGDYDEPEQVVI